MYVCVRQRVCVCVYIHKHTRARTHVGNGLIAQAQHTHVPKLSIHTYTLIHSHSNTHSCTQTPPRLHTDAAYTQTDTFPPYLSLSITDTHLLNGLETYAVLSLVEHPGRAHAQFEALSPHVLNQDTQLQYIFVCVCVCVCLCMDVTCMSDVRSNMKCMCKKEHQR
jgi:hypothetical protein